MKKKIMILLIACVFCMSVIGCGDSTNKDTKNAAEKEEQGKEPIDLTGIWASEDNNGSYQEAIITENTIEINWMSDGDATKSVYWIGSYAPPTEATDEYSWTSERDKEKTASAMLASTDDTKEFTYKDKKISYEVTALGITSTMTLTQTSTEVPESSVAAEQSEATPNDTANTQEQTNEAPYEVTYQNISFHQDSIGTLWSQAIVEVTNTGENELYLNGSSYELKSEDGTIIHTTSNMFTAYPQIIGPGEKGYYYEEAMMDGGTPAEGITITPHINAQPSQVENIRLEVSNTAIYDKDMGGIDLHGKVTNTTGTEQSNIYVAAILFDDNGHPIGQLWTILMNTIQPNEEMGFELEPMSLPEDITSSSIADYKVFAYPEQYQY